MIKTSQSIGKLTFKVVMAGIAVSCLGVAVVAAPLSITPKSKIYAQLQAGQERTALAPLAAGPSMQLGKASGGAEEDCVRVTRVTGPDGTIYATRGTVCAR